MCSLCDRPAQRVMRRIDWYGGFFAFLLLGFIVMAGLRHDIELMARAGDMLVGALVAWGGIPYIVGNEYED